MKGGNPNRSSGDEGKEDVVGSSENTGTPTHNVTPATPTSSIPLTDLGHENDEDDVEVYKPMPDDWIHPLSLVVAIFSKLSENPCSDLQLDFGSGPELKSENKKRKASSMGNAGKAQDGTSSISMSTENPLLSSDTTRHMVPPGQTQSRAQYSASKQAIDDRIAKAKY